MSRCVNHQSSIGKSWLVFDSDWEIKYLAALYLEAWTLNGLNESLKSSNKPDICLSVKLSAPLIYIQLICLFFNCEDTSKHRI
jgi:hypothetical protein